MYPGRVPGGLCLGNGSLLLVGFFFTRSISERRDLFRATLRMHWSARMKPSTEPSSQDYTTTDHSQHEPSTAAYTSYGETERSGDQSPYEMSDDDGYSSSEAGDREYTYYEGEDEVGDTGRMFPARSTPRSAYPSSLAPLLQNEDLLAAVVACLEDNAEREFHEAACN